MQNITVLGATGSIGLNTLDICRQHPDLYKVIALTANHDVEGMLKLCDEFKPDYAVMADEHAGKKLAENLVNLNDVSTQVMVGDEALVDVASLDENDMVMAAIVGAAGLLPALAAVKKGKKLLLANKEALVMSGHLFMDAANLHGAQILPIDSEHNAIFQCMPADYQKGLGEVGVSRVLLTASGGPFLHTPAEQLSGVTPEQAVSHPNWDMGKKISVDSATMMNKGLEVVEARWLFNASPEKIEVVVHPQSVVHSMVEYDDGSVLAQMGNPDMRTPIAHAMAWPQRIGSGVSKLDLFEVGRLDFYKPDYERFACLKLAFDALKEKDSAPAILNAANEISVMAFLQNQIGFTKIPEINALVLNGIAAEDIESIDHLLEIDERARLMANNFVRQRLN